jgi:hypothetical protein
MVVRVMAGFVQNNYTVSAAVPSMGFFLLNQAVGAVSRMRLAFATVCRAICEILMIVAVKFTYESIVFS